MMRHLSEFQGDWILSYLHTPLRKSHQIIITKSSPVSPAYSLHDKECRLKEQEGDMFQIVQPKITQKGGVEDESERKESSKKAWGGLQRVGEWAETDE